MRPPPLLHPNHVGLAFPPIRVAGFAQPRPLARRLALLAAGLPVAVALLRSITCVGDKKDGAVQAFARADWMHRLTWAHPPAASNPPAHSPAITSVKRKKNHPRKKCFLLLTEKKNRRRTDAFLTARNRRLHARRLEWTLTRHSWLSANVTFPGGTRCICRPLPGNHTQGINPCFQPPPGRGEAPASDISQSRLLTAQSAMSWIEPFSQTPPQVTVSPPASPGSPA